MLLLLNKGEYCHKTHLATAGEMQKLQMMKIEELTLYIIEMNKRIEMLEKENTKLKKQLK